MKAQIELSSIGGVLNTVIIDICDESDPKIGEAVSDIVAGGFQVGDTIMVTEVQE